LTPLPPYIKRPDGVSLTDNERYQTIYSKARGAIAAPTAGLHFTDEQLSRLRERNQLVEITLHVGYGTFEPVRVDDVNEHEVSSERFEITFDAAQRINQTRERGGRIVAVGTTTTRALESASSDSGQVQPGSSEATLTIKPGYRFRVVDALLTNFSLTSIITADSFMFVCRSRSSAASVQACSRETVSFLQLWGLHVSPLGGIKKRGGKSRVSLPTVNTMAVLKKFRSRWWSQADVPLRHGEEREAVTPSWGMRYDIRPLTISQLDECWRLDQRCFIDGEAYSRETFDYLLTAPEAVSYRAVTSGGVMVGFVIGLVEPDHTGHVTTVGVSPEHRRRSLAKRLMAQVEDGFRKRNVRLVRLEVRALNTPAQKLYENLGYSITQRLPKYYSNGGDGLLMLKSLV
jgi:ribosomal protein S18 acetylase RimI-like enzyme